MQERHITIFDVFSDSFTPGGKIPRIHGYKSGNVVPTIGWKGAPATTKSFTLVMYDPGATNGCWIHYLIYDIGISGEIPHKTGLNSWGQADYGGPSPPSGVHTFYFTMFALDIMLNPKKPLDIREFQKRIVGHVIACGQTTGTYAA
jgi:Raf kinase inhibitor-like YbhB/YbcL family protein